MAATTLTDRNQKNRVTTDQRREQWRLIRDCIEGEDAIKAGETKYLPKPGNMETANNPSGQAMWVNYLARATFFGVPERTLLMLVGMATRAEPIVSKETPEAMQPMFDGESGLSLLELTDWLFTETLSVNFAGVMVDTDAEEQVGQLPYAALYYAESIMDRAWEVKRGKKRLTYIKLAEDLTGKEVEHAGYEATERTRELYMDNGSYTYKLSVTYQPVGEVVGDKKPIVDEEVKTPEFRGKKLNFIPFTLIPDVDDAKPALLDLCKVCLALYRNSADYEWSLFMTAQPTPWVTGATDEDKLGTIGPGQIWKITNPNAKVGMLEFQGTGIEATQLAMQDKKEEMASLGAYLIRGNVSRNESEETARLRNSGETSALRKAVNAVEVALKDTYRFAAIMLGLPPEKVDITCNRDFIESTLSGEELLKYVKAWQGAEKGMKGPGLDDESFVNILKAGELVDASKTTAEVIAGIEATKKRMDKMVAETQAVTGLATEPTLDPVEGVAA